MHERAEQDLLFIINKHHCSPLALTHHSGLHSHWLALAFAMVVTFATVKASIFNIIKIRITAVLEATSNILSTEDLAKRGTVQVFVNAIRSWSWAWNWHWSRRNWKGSWWHRHRWNWSWRCYARSFTLF